jgi:hypothetical protein
MGEGQPKDFLMSCVETVGQKIRKELGMKIRNGREK